MTFDETVTRAEYRDLLKMETTTRELVAAVADIERSDLLRVSKLAAELQTARYLWYESKGKLEAVEARMDTIAVEKLRRKDLPWLERESPTMAAATRVMEVT